MFFSISIPVHNAERYLNRCIRSVISQTEGDYELILVDDGLQDSSLDICIHWADKYPDKIRVIKNWTVKSSHTKITSQTEMCYG